MNSTKEPNPGDNAPENTNNTAPPDPAAAAVAALRKAEQARINGAKSKGPTSAHGKRQSSKNAYKHGLTAKNIVPSNQNGEFFNEMLAAFRHDFDPATLAEVQCIDRMAHAALNQNSAGIEITALIDHKRIQMASTTHTDPTMPEQLRNALAVEALVNDGPTFDNYQRYLRDADRRYSRALRDLILLRKTFRQDTATTRDEMDLQPAHPPAPSPVLRHILIESGTAATSELPPPPPPNLPPDSPIQTPLRKNEPTEVTENTDRAHTETQPESGAQTLATPVQNSTDSYIGAIPTPAVAQTPEGQPNPSNEKSAKPPLEPGNDNPQDEWASLLLIRKVLYAFPEAYKAVSVALRDLPKEDYFL